MSAREIDDYLANLEEPKRTTLQKLRQTILSIIPQAEQGIAYGCPAFRMYGKVVAGFAAFKDHLSYPPHSGSVFKQIPEEVAGYHTSSGALQFPINKPLRKALVNDSSTYGSRKFLSSSGYGSPHSCSRCGAVSIEVGHVPAGRLTACLWDRGAR